MKCLKINKKKFDPNEGWDCPICDWRKEIPRSSTRPTLSQLKEWVDSAASLPFIPEELKIVNRIVAAADTWIASIQPIIHAGQIHSINKCRFYLRKIEGAEVFLPNEYNFFRRTAHRLAPLTLTPPPVIEESKSQKKARPKKPKPENIPQQAPQQPQQFPPLTIRPIHHSGHQEIRIHPAQAAHPRPTEQPQLPPQQYQVRQRYLPYDPDSVPVLHSQPPKGMFAPPPQQLPPQPRRLSDHMGERPGPTCGACHKKFISGAHNEPKACSQCNRLHHLQCIGKYGGRIYPSMVWYILSSVLPNHSPDCVKQHPNAFQTLPPLPVKRPPLPMWNLTPVGTKYLLPYLITGTPLNYTKANTLIPPAHRAVIDLTDSRSPSPDARPSTAITVGPGPSNLRMSHSFGTPLSPQLAAGAGQSGPRNQSVDIDNPLNGIRDEKRNMSTPPISTDRSPNSNASPMAPPKLNPPNPSTAPSQPPPTNSVEKDNRQDHSIKRILVE